jgi:hypothetical protein
MPHNTRITHWTLAACGASIAALAACDPAATSTTGYFAETTMSAQTAPVPTDSAPAHFSVPEDVKLVSIRRGDWWVRGLNEVVWTFEAKVTLQRAKDLFVKATGRDPNAGDFGKIAGAAYWSVDRTGCVLNIEIRKGLVRHDMHKGNTSVIDLDSGVTIQVTEQPKISGPLPEKWWRGAIVPTTPTEIIPCPIDAKATVSSIRPTRFFTSPACHWRMGYVFSALFDQPCEAVIDEGKMKLVGNGYEWQGPEYVVQGFVSATQNTYWIKVEPELESFSKRPTGKTVVSWFWSTQTGPMARVKAPPDQGLRR